MPVNGKNGDFDKIFKFDRRGEFIDRAWLLGRGFLIGEMFFGGGNRIADLPSEESLC